MKASIWVERYRPKTLEDVIFQDERQRNAFKAFVEQGDIPHLLLSGIQGTGKTTISKALIHDLNIDRSDCMRINCSDEKIDALRSKVSAFAMTMPMGKFKVVQLEECLQSDTLIRVMRDGREQGIPVKDVNAATDLVRSYDGKKTVWLPFTKKSQGKRKLIRVTFKNGDSFLTTENHPWVSEDKSTIRSDQLLKGTRIFSPSINRLSNDGQTGNEQQKKNTAC